MLNFGGVPPKKNKGVQELHSYSSHSQFFCWYCQNLLVILLMAEIRLTSWSGKYPIIYRVFIHPFGGCLGFQPSTFPRFLDPSLLHGGFQKLWRLHRSGKQLHHKAILPGFQEGIFGSTPCWIKKGCSIEVHTNTHIMLGNACFCLVVALCWMLGRFWVIKGTSDCFFLNNWKIGSQ